MLAKHIFHTFIALIAFAVPVTTFAAVSILLTPEEFLKKGLVF
jgi:hypothetical protein